MIMGNDNINLFSELFQKNFQIINLVPTYKIVSTYKQCASKQLLIIKQS